MGPEGGDRGGTVIAQGTPEEIVKVKKSYTGYYIKQMLDRAKEREAKNKASVKNTEKASTKTAEKPKTSRKKKTED